MKPGKHKTVQARILASYSQEIGWAFVSREEAEQRRRGIPASNGAENGGCWKTRAPLSLFFDHLLHFTGRRPTHQSPPEIPAHGKGPQLAGTTGKGKGIDRFPAGAGFPGKSSADWGWVQHIHASLNDAGRAAVVLDTCAASRGSGNAGASKEKTVRQWFVDHDLVESVLYLPENLFYNTTAPGIVLFLNKAKPKNRKGKVFLVNAGQVFEKGDPKNFIPEDGIARIADTLINWTETEKLSRIVDHAELAKNDYNISPSRYIHTNDAETYRPIAEIVAELKAIEAEAKETDKDLDTILRQLGVDA